MRHLQLTFLCFIFLSALPPLAAAQPADLISVDFEATPLFSGAKLLPGDAVGRTVTVTNVSGDTQSIQFAFENVVQGDLAEVMELAVSSESEVYQFDTFDELMDGGPYGLGNLAPGEDRAYTFYAAFPSGAGNEYQLSQFEFDLVIGANAGDQTTDDDSVTRTSVSGSGSTRALRLFNESVTVDFGVGGALVTWDSNLPASSYMVCAEVTAGGVELSTEPPLFGYQFALEERFEDSLAHGFILDDLKPAEYECRPAGRRVENGSFTVGDPVRFTIPAPPAGQVAGVSTSIPSLEELLAAALTTKPPQQEMVLGASKGAGELTYEQFRAEIEQKKNAEGIMSTRAQLAEGSDPTSGIAATAKTADYSTPEGVRASLFLSWWPWMVGALVAMAIAWWFLRRSRGM